MRSYCAGRKIKYWLWLLDVIADAYIWLLYRHRKRETPRSEQPRILAITFGHLGDALVFSYTFPAILQRYPGAIIDILAGDWSDPVFKGNPYIRQIVHLNHLETNRKKISWLQKVIEHWNTTRWAIHALKKEDYDYSIDIRYSDSVSHFILPFLHVRKAIGFGTRGLGGFLDKELFLPNEEFHHFDQTARLLQEIDVWVSAESIVPYFELGDNSLGKVLQKLGVIWPPNGVALICPETGDTSRALSSAFWEGLVKDVLIQTTWQIWFCGQTAFTKKLYQTCTENNTQFGDRLIDTCGKLNLKDLSALSSAAQIAFTLESLPAHLCSITCDTISFFKNGSGLQFFPISTQRVLVIHNHQKSKETLFQREGFEGIYVENIDTTLVREMAIGKAIAWSNDEHIKI